MKIYDKLMPIPQQGRNQDIEKIKMFLSLWWVEWQGRKMARIWYGKQTQKKIELSHVFIWPIPNVKEKDLKNNNHPTPNNELMAMIDVP